jgi:hypothetical protein
MDQTGLINNILDAVEAIALGRRGYAAKGQEMEGRVHYEHGISIALASFKEAEVQANPETIALLEQAFLQQELAFCAEGDQNARDSLNSALMSFDDAFLCFDVIDDPGYISVEKSYPHNKKYRVQGFPKDAVHIACIAHQTRLRNVLRAPGIDMIEKAVLEQRAANMKAAQQSYIAKQQKALGGAEGRWAAPRS